MKTVLAVRHISFEDLGIWETELQSQGYRVEYLEAPLADFRQYDPLSYDLVVILGAPIGAFAEAQYPFISKELEFIEKRLSADLPLLGICLGAQFIARLLGAAVTPLPVPEIGYAPLTFTAPGKDSALAALGKNPVLHWHGDQFEIPAGATHLAATEKCANQAFTYGKATLALQFHLEANSLKIEQWLVGHASELAQAQLDLAQLRAAAAEYGPDLAKVSLTTLRTWQNQVGLN